MKKKRKSRWSDEKGLAMCNQALAPPGVIVPSLAPTSIGVPTIPGMHYLAINFNIKPFYNNF